MRIKYILAIVLVLFLLVGCGTTEVEDDNVKVSDVETEEIDEVDNKPSLSEEELLEKSEEETVEEPKVLPKEVKEILEKSKTRLKNYKYNFVQPGDTTIYQMYVLGDNIMKVYPRQIKLKDTVYYDTIYIDVAKETAEAYCIEESNCNKDNLGVKMGDTIFKEEYLKLPTEWADEIEWAEIVDENIVEGRDCLSLNTNIGAVILETYYGWIYEIVDEDENTWKFTGTAFNSVKEDDVTP